MNLIALSAFTDNYIWMFHDGTHAVVVDPGDSAPVIATLDAQRLVLAAILVTHHHADHVGGIGAKLGAKMHRQHCPLRSIGSAVLIHSCVVTKPRWRRPPVRTAQLPTNPWRY